MVAPVTWSTKTAAGLEEVGKRRATKERTEERMDRTASKRR